MKCYREILCPECGSTHIRKAGFSARGVQRYRCDNPECQTKSFMLTYRYTAYEPGIKDKIVDMAMNSSGVRDTARVLSISKGTVISTLKKKNNILTQVNPNYLPPEGNQDGGLEVSIGAVCEAELDEQWSFVGNKANQRWLWYAVDHASNTVLGYVFGKRKDVVFEELKDLLDPIGITRYYTDDWGAYERHLEAQKHQIGKRNTQKIERKNLNLRTWIKRLARKTICFSKSELMHDTVIGLLINRVEFGVDIHTRIQV